MRGRPGDYPRLVQPLLSGEVQVVYGARYLAPAIASSPLGVSALNVAARLLYRGRLTDEPICYNAFPTAVLREMHIVCQRFEFCPEVTAKAWRMGLKIVEVPIRYRPPHRR